ncbi:MAG: hypothetical protein KAR40_13930 [Candidatus Sabulitectum sp.]|nr:hypothetical protein [Candidatus Sabulitectum sp.]
MARDTDGIIQEKFAASGDVGLGDLVIDDGWPIAYSTPGGKNPQRLQFNQLYRNLFALAKELNQKGPFLEYSALITYAEGARVIVSGNIMRSLSGGNLNNDPASSPTKWAPAHKSAKIQPVDSSIAANALTLTINPTELDFRSETLASGTVNSRILNAAISLVISAGSTLGTVSTIQSRIAILAIDNAGTIEPAAVNLAGGNNLDETTLITTVAEGGAGVADSANVIYSETARANVPFRVVGYVESTQPVAGTWDATPSTIQGYGGQAMAAMSSLGYGQTVQDVSGSRTDGVTYYNTTGKPIRVDIAMQVPTAGPSTIQLTIGGVSYFGTGSAVIDVAMYVTGIVPPGGSYSVDLIGGTGSSIQSWVELR